MEIKATAIIGLKIISISNGEKIEDVSDVIYIPQENKLKALLVDKGGLFSSAKVIMFADILSFGEDAIMVQSPDVIKKVSDITEEIKNIAKDNEYLTKTKVITEAGKELGVIDDVFFDTTTGNVTKFEVSEGIIGNIKSGKKLIDKNDILTIGHDSVIVSKFTEEIVKEQSQSQGVQGAVNKGSDKANDMASTVGDKTKEILGKVQDKMNAPETHEKVDNIVSTIGDKSSELFNKVKEKTSDAVGNTKDKLDEKTKNAALGKFLKVNVLDKNDQIIAKRGDMITHEIMGKAEENGVLENVLLNTQTEELI